MDRATACVFLVGSLFVATMGCGAATVAGTAGDAAMASADLPPPDLDSNEPDVPFADSFPIDAGGADASVADATARDVAPEARVCPVIDDVPAPDVPASDALHVVDLAVAAQLHQCALMSDGTVRCQGFNDTGQLGLGTSVFSIRESTTVPGLAEVEQVVTTNIGTTCTRHRDGSVRCWGSNEYDTTGTGHDGDDRCGSQACRTRPTLVPGLTDVVFLAASDFTVCAVRRDGSLWCWGIRISPESTNSEVPRRVPGYTNVAALWPRGLRFGFVLRDREGHYRATRGDSTGPVPDVASIDGAAGSDHICYVLPDATARCLGLNADGKVGNGESAWPGDVTTPVDPGLCSVRSVVTGSYHTCAILADRTVSCWGSNTNGALGFVSTERCAGINDASDCATRPTPVPGIDSVEQLFLGVWGTCALRLDHSVWCWGSLSPTRSMIPAPAAW